MTVDIKLNDMIDDIDRRLRAIHLNDVELSTRARNALKHAGAVTLHDAQALLVSGKLYKLDNVGRKTVNEVREIIANISRMTPDKVERRLGRRITDLQEVPTAEPSLIVEHTPVADKAEMLRWQLGQKEAQYQRLVQTNNGLQADVARLSSLLRERDEHAAKMRRRMTRVLDSLTIEQLKAMNVSFQIDWDEVDEGE